MESNHDCHPMFYICKRVLTKNRCISHSDLMKEFLKPTKDKSFITIIIFICIFIIWYEWILPHGLSMQARFCLSSLPLESNPAPFSISQTLNDLGNPYCLGNDPSARVANAILPLILLGQIIFAILICYFLACIIVFGSIKFIKQKNSKNAKLKK